MNFQERLQRTIWYLPHIAFRLQWTRRMRECENANANTNENENENERPYTFSSVELDFGEGNYERASWWWRWCSLLLVLMVLYFPQQLWCVCACESCNESFCGNEWPSSTLWIISLNCPKCIYISKICLSSCSFSFYCWLSLCISITSFLSSCTCNALISLQAHTLSSHHRHHIQYIYIYNTSECFIVKWLVLNMEGVESLLAYATFYIVFVHIHILCASVVRIVHTHGPYALFMQTIFAPTPLSRSATSFYVWIVAWYLQYCWSMIQINWLRYKPIWLKCRRKTHFPSVTYFLSQHTLGNHLMLWHCHRILCNKNKNIFIFHNQTGKWFVLLDPSYRSR